MSTILPFPDSVIAMMNVSTSPPDPASDAQAFGLRAKLSRELSVVSLRAFDDLKNEP
jgi:hypothetical protein